MRITSYLILFGTIIFFTGCSCDATKSQERTDKGIAKQSGPAGIAMNKTQATIRVEEVELKEHPYYTIKGYLVSATETAGYNSIATAGEVYELEPAFVINDMKEIEKDSEKNIKLISLRELKKGDVFNAQISLIQNREDKRNIWYITETAE